MANGNGKTFTAMLAIISALVGVVAGSIGAGVYFGSTTAQLDAHIKGTPNIHETGLQKEVRIRTIVDREISPDLARMQRQLDRIEAKLDGHTGE